MADISVDKFVDVISQDYGRIDYDPFVLDRVVGNMVKPDYSSAKISLGPTAVLESTSADGGGTAFLSRIC
jgi:hypothetical protein